MNGPHIYDSEGELVWSGACLYDNLNVFNFKPVSINGSHFLTFFVSEEERGSKVVLPERLPSGVLMNNRFEEVSRTYAKGSILDAHEFNLQPHGRSTLLTTLNTVDMDASSIGQKTRRVLNTGFQEVEIDTGKLYFDWDPVTSGIPLNESCDTTGIASTDMDTAWDHFHINSVDKFANGDYIISSRHLSAVYRVSHRDGRVVWKLGGCSSNSDFEMAAGLPFSWQHHATVQAENETHIVISVFDNASEDLDRGEPTGRNPPAGKIIVLDMQAMTARLLRRFDRPDGGQTALLGSISALGDDISTSHVLVNWAMEGYISEYDASDRLILEARFLTDRKRSYRAYKGPFIGDPAEPPVLKLLPIGFSQDEVVSAFYLSWNGATAVTSWALYSGESIDGKTFQHLATIKKRGFETSWMMPIMVRYAYAEALDVEHKVLGRTNVASVAPGFDTDYRVSYPALEGTRPAGEQSIGTTSDSCFSKTDRLSPSHGQQSRFVIGSKQKSFTNESRIMFTNFITYTLAVFGLYSIARGIIYKTRKRRKGNSLC
ncbi:hypothetical protein LTR37_005472 [Vermiconidia calcicola]|uniref:Uncharacterized protein n=1 Tax=Vermiconidia calcicola TaxID=1690605 RepID=A0ACC3NJ98_9PEZI|nr:hypothetical protein LTR37_005472 [Vermiconidia calcicola]